MTRRIAFAVFLSLSSLGQNQPDTEPAAPASTLYALGLVGLSANSSSASSPSQQYFTEFNLIAPFNCFEKRVPYPLGHKCWFWLNPRIASVPAPGTPALSGLGSSAASLGAGLNSQNFSEITQSLELQEGIEFYLKNPWQGTQFGRDQNWARSSISFMAGGGIVTPFSSVASAAEFALNPNVALQFNQNPGLAAQYPNLAQALCGYGYSGPACAKATPVTSPSTVAFVPPTRSRFYRDFYAGLRLRSFYLTGDCPDPSLEKEAPNCKPENIFPGTFEMRFGEDETATAGHLVPLVMTFAASYPLPGTSGALRIFGSVCLRFARNRTTQPLALLPSSSYATLDQPSVVIQPIPAVDQDYYRLGLGVDLIPLVAKWASH